MPNSEQNTKGPTIRQLEIQNFRGIHYLKWHPAPGMNIVTGPGDVGKSTILRAIAFLLSPAPVLTITEFDFHERSTAHNVTIEAVLALNDLRQLSEEGFPPPPLRGWKNNALSDLPDEDGAEPVIHCRLSVNKDFETEHRIVGAGDQAVPFRRSLRQTIGLMRLGLADRYDRDLRLVQGGALDHFIGSRDLRDTILQTIFKTSIHDALNPDVQSKLKEIEDKFLTESLPLPVRLGLVGAPGVSVASTVGLMIGNTNERALPITSWGSGTQKFASLAMTSLVSADHAIALVDEPESGLEPYRQRTFIRKLLGGGNRQSFIITHSPAVLETAMSLGGTVWRLRCTPLSAAPAVSLATPRFLHNCINLSERTELKKTLQNDPEALLAKLPIVCEGKTELGFTQVILENHFGEDYRARGIHPFEVVGGNSAALIVCQKFIETEIPFTCVADDEGTHTGSWQAVIERSPCLRWDNQQCIEQVIFGLLPAERLLEILDWAEFVNSREKRHLIPEVRKALGADVTLPESEWPSAFGKAALLKAITEIAVPPASKNKGWFKSIAGGRCLAMKMLEIGPDEALQKKLDPFFAAVRQQTECP